MISEKTILSCINSKLIQDSWKPKRGDRIVRKNDHSIINFLDSNDFKVDELYEFAWIPYEHQIFELLLPHFYDSSTLIKFISEYLFNCTKHLANDESILDIYIKIFYINQFMIYNDKIKSLFN